MAEYLAVPLVLALLLGGTTPGDLRSSSASSPELRTQASPVIQVAVDWATSDRSIGAPLYALVGWSFASSGGDWYASDCENYGASGSTKIPHAITATSAGGALNLSGRCFVAQPPTLEPVNFSGLHDENRSTLPTTLEVVIPFSCGSGCTQVTYANATFPVGSVNSSVTAPRTSRTIAYNGGAAPTITGIGCNLPPNVRASTTLCADPQPIYLDVGLLPVQSENEVGQPAAQGASSYHVAVFEALCDQVLDANLTIAPVVQASVGSLTPTWNFSSNEDDPPYLRVGVEYCAAQWADEPNGSEVWSEGTQFSAEFREASAPETVYATESPGGLNPAEAECDPSNQAGGNCASAWGNFSMLAVGYTNRPSGNSYPVGWAELGLSYSRSIASSEIVNASGLYPQDLQEYDQADCVGPLPNLASSALASIWGWSNESGVLYLPFFHYPNAITPQPGSAWSFQIYSSYSREPYGFASPCITVYLAQGPPGTSSSNSSPILVFFGGIGHELLTDPTVDAGAAGVILLVLVLVLLASADEDLRLRRRFR